MSQAVTDFINNIDQPWQIEIAERIRQLIKETLTDVEERIQYNKPHFLKNGKYAAVIAPAKGWVSFMIFNPDQLAPPGGLFEKGVPERSTIKIREGQDVDYELLGTFLKEATRSL